MQLTQDSANGHILENINLRFDYIKVRELVDIVIDYWLINKDFAPRI
jgi:hypothetical protein